MNLTITQEELEELHGLQKSIIENEIKLFNVEYELEEQGKAFEEVYEDFMDRLAEYLKNDLKIKKFGWKIIKENLSEWAYEQCKVSLDIDELHKDSLNTIKNILQKASNQ